ncbi:hypothetical protein CBM2586_B130590 [Cupriavidus phytorum]|uniref:Uncharacterized protein n=1 Tax=Cupriavidus taiwanensis TaxID=164546 RepID=A0A976AAA0_9BURK|nr:hypothetical protein CBM2586_B130590 [Cupriavidus taiwanensis]
MSFYAYVDEPYDPSTHTHMRLGRDSPLK